MTSKERYLAAVGGQDHDRVPVTPIFMAWAARHVGHTYREFYLDGEVLVKAQSAVTQAFQVDQISAISDPWRESSAYGMEFDYPPDGVGVPRDRLLKAPQDVGRLGRLDFLAAERPRQRIDSVRRMAAEFGATHSVLGWAEGPIAQYGDLRGVEQAMMDLLDCPDLYERAAGVIVANAVEFARLQIEAGADTVGVGDSAASLVGPQLYRQYVLPWEKRLFDGIHAAGGLVKLHICGNTSDIVADMAATGADVIDLDWMVDIARARQTVGADVTLCGNFNPAGVLLRGTPDQVAAAARKCIADGGPRQARPALGLPKGGNRFILQPGCEVPPGTPEANIRAFCPGDGCLIRDALGEKV